MATHHHDLKTARSHQTTQRYSQTPPDVEDTQREQTVLRGNLEIAQTQKIFLEGQTALLRHQEQQAAQQRQQEQQVLQSQQQITQDQLLQRDNGLAACTLMNVPPQLPEHLRVTKNYDENAIAAQPVKKEPAGKARKLFNSLSRNKVPKPEKKCSSCRYACIQFICILYMHGREFLWFSDLLLIERFAYTDYWALYN